jgi:hypothetical protein
MTLPISSTVEEFKTATQALVIEARAGVTQSRWRALVQEDQELRRRWRLAHGRDDGLAFAQAVPFERALPDPRSP